MKYKVGDKFLVEVKITGMIAGKNAVVSEKRIYNEEELDKLRRPDDMTADEAWEIAVKLIKMTIPDRTRIFGYCEACGVVNNYSFSEIKAKIEEWEAEKEIKVGDIVAWVNNENGVVTRIEDGFAFVMWQDGSCGKWECKKLQKTGRNKDIQSVLEQIGGVE